MASHRFVEGLFAIVHVKDLYRIPGVIVCKNPIYCTSCQLNLIFIELFFVCMFSVLKLLK